MQLREVMRDWLEANGYDGLLRPEDRCCCTTDSDHLDCGFMRCMGRDSAVCVPGHVEVRLDGGDMVEGPRKKGED